MDSYNQLVNEITELEEKLKDINTQLCNPELYQQTSKEQLNLLNSLTKQKDDLEKQINLKLQQYL